MKKIKSEATEKQLASEPAEQSASLPLEEREEDAYHIKTETPEQKARKAERRADFRKFVLPMVVILLLFFGAGIKYARYIDGRPDIPVAVAGDIVATSGFDAPKASTDLVVKISGQVRQEGFFSISANTSMRELVEYAGVKKDGEITDLDMSHKLVHGDEIYIKNKNNPVDATPWINNSYVPKEEPGETEIEEPININKADLKELMDLPGIGEVKAQAIIDYRTKQGAFQYKEDILGVEGIGNKLYEDIKDQITI